MSLCLISIVLAAVFVTYWTRMQIAVEYELLLTIVAVHDCLLTDTEVIVAIE